MRGGSSAWSGGSSEGPVRPAQRALDDIEVGVWRVRRLTDRPAPAGTCVGPAGPAGGWAPADPFAAQLSASRGPDAAMPPAARIDEPPSQTWSCRRLHVWRAGI